MDLMLDDLIIKIANIDLNELMDSWRWLLPDMKGILIISKMGDMFSSTADGKIYWIATDSGGLTKIADSYSEFEQMLNNEDNIDNWFLPSLIEELIKENQILKNKQVYSFKKLPVLGGEYSVDNIEATDVSVHFGLTGMICEQIKDLPNGTSIKIKLVD